MARARGRGTRCSCGAARMRGACSYPPPRARALAGPEVSPWRGAPQGEVPHEEVCHGEVCLGEVCLGEACQGEVCLLEGPGGLGRGRLEGPGWAASWLAAGLAASHRSMGPPAHYSLLTTRHAPLTAYPALRTPHYAPLPLTRHQVPRIPRPALRRRGRLVARGGALLAQDGRGADGAAAQRLGQ